MLKRTIVVSALAFSSCVVTASAREIPAVKSGALRATGILVVLPARDCIQAGRPHPKCTGTGAYFQQQLAAELKALTNFEVTVAPEEVELSSSAPISTEAAQAFGTRVAASYVFRATLGEFRNAAPMTGRSDFITLETADLIDVVTGKVVWGLREPIVTERQGNLGNHFELLDEIARPLAQRIAANQPRGVCPASQRPEWKTSSAVEKKRMTTECSSTD